MIANIIQSAGAALMQFMLVSCILVGVLVWVMKKSPVAREIGKAAGGIAFGRITNRPRF
jgi:hypothetical protein